MRFEPNRFRLAFARCFPLGFAFGLAIGFAAHGAELLETFMICALVSGLVEHTNGFGQERGGQRLTLAGLLVATCGYTRAVETGIRELKNNLSRYIRRIEAGDRIAVTSHGRVVAELVPPAKSRAARSRQPDRLVAEGIIRPALEKGDPLEEWPDIRLPRGTAAALIDSDRDEE